MLQMLQNSPVAELAVFSWRFFPFPASTWPVWSPDVQMAPQYHVKGNRLDRQDIRDDTSTLCPKGNRLLTDWTRSDIDISEADKMYLFG